MLYLNKSIYGINNATILKLIANSQLKDGGAKTISTYFNGGAQHGFIDGRIAFVIFIFLMAFGLTLFTVSDTFSFVGILTSIIGLAILSLAIQTNYIITAEVIDAIILIVFIAAQFQPHKINTTV